MNKLTEHQLENLLNGLQYCKQQATDGCGTIWQQARSADEEADAINQVAEVQELIDIVKHEYDTYKPAKRTLTIEQARVHVGAVIAYESMWADVNARTVERIRQLLILEKEINELTVLPDADESGYTDLLADESSFAGFEQSADEYAICVGYFWYVERILQDELIYFDTDDIGPAIELLSLRLSADQIDKLYKESTKPVSQPEQTVIFDASHGRTDEVPAISAFLETLESVINSDQPGFDVSISIGNNKLLAYDHAALIQGLQVAITDYLEEIS